MSDKFYADISWTNNEPYSNRFTDIYASANNAIAEANYVFLQHNQLQNRFTQLLENTTFVIAETGFGCAVNFLATIELWDKYAPATAKLYFISFEINPLSPQDLHNFFAQHPDFATQKSTLLSQYEFLLPGINRLNFANNVFLNLVIGDISQTLNNYNFHADCWFLDGFAPSKNQDMWSEQIIQEIAAHSKIGTSFATYTCAGLVRQLLTKHGFDVYKTKGFGIKRHMLHGCLKLQQYKLPSISWLNPLAENKQNNEKTVIIIGGGIAGASSANAMAQRGYIVYLIEEQESLATQASGNPQGILYNTWSAETNGITYFANSAYHYAYHLINKTPNIVKGKTQLIQLHNSQNIASRLDKYTRSSYLPDNWVTTIDGQQITKLSNLSPDVTTASLFHYSYWISPASLVSSLIRHPNIHVLTNTEITRLEYKKNTWLVFCQDRLVQSASYVIVANANKINQFIQTCHYKTKTIRGQTTQINAHNPSNIIICAEGYLIPNNGKEFTIGATFNPDDGLNQARAEDDLENIDNLSEIDVRLSSIGASNIRGSKVGVRTSTYNKHPLVGPVLDYEQFIHDFARLSLDKNYRIKNTCTYLPNLYMNVAHGAKGILTTGISAEIIADMIDNGVVALFNQSIKEIHPNRIIAKEIISKTL